MTSSNPIVFIYFCFLLKIKTLTFICGVNHWFWEKIGKSKRIYIAWKISLIFLDFSWFRLSLTAFFSTFFDFFGISITEASQSFTHVYIFLIIFSGATSEFNDFDLLLLTYRSSCTSSCLSSKHNDDEFPCSLSMRHLRIFVRNTKESCPTHGKTHESKEIQMQRLLKGVSPQRSPA